jgi:hypothetical protein
LLTKQLLVTVCVANNCLLFVFRDSTEEA